MIKINLERYIKNIITFKGPLLEINSVQSIKTMYIQVMIIN